MANRFSAFGREFSPSWPMTLLTLVLLGAFVGLGFWQWQRGAAKQAVWAEFRRDLPAVDPGAKSLDDLPRFTRVALEGVFEVDRQFLLDNRTHAGRPGYEVLTPMRLPGGRRVLVNRGWVPFTGYREKLPEISLATPGARITGRVEELPSRGLASGHAAPSTGPEWPKLTSFPTHAELEQVLGAKLSRRIVLLDAGLPDGYVREWTPPGVAPDRHFSYAIQWWGFALVLLVIYFGLNLRKVT